MKIKRETPVLFVRISDYKKYNYVEEHKKVLDKNGYVWLLKIGKKSNENFVKKVLENGGGLIIKSTAKHGHNFYYCTFTTNKVDDSLLYPDYYNEIFDDEYYDLEELKKSCSWFKIEKMVPLSEEQVKKFVVIKTRRNLLECGTMFRVNQMYLEADEDIIINE